MPALECATLSLEIPEVLKLLSPAQGSDPSLPSGLYPYPIIISPPAHLTTCPEVLTLG